MSKLPKILLYFLGVVFVLNLFQSFFTELIFDESYYWYYAQEMAWGYFDHPSMVALLIKISSFFFDRELGVRFVSCILNIGTYFILWKLIDHPKKQDYVREFCVLVFSMTLLHAYGFFMLPDTPLLFFTALFLLIYKQFLSSPGVLVSLAMGVVMAALMYSKYNAVLIIFFVLLSNIKLVFNKYAWLAVIVSLVCYTPHFLWLYENDFVSVKYHLFERPNRAYEFADFTLGYFANLLAIFGLTFPFVYWSLFKTKASNKFIKALLYLTYGVLIFFFISSFNRRVQTQWIIVISIPMAILAFNFMLQNQTAKKWIYRLGIVNIIILLYLRIGLVHAPLFPIFYETHGNKQWVNDIQSKIGDMPVVFENSYRQAPMYAFYTGNKTFSLNNIMYRQNQFTIDSSEAKVQHQKVLYVSKYLKKGDFDYTTVSGTKYFGRYMDDFESFRGLKCIIDNENVSLTNDAELTLKVYNPYDVDINLKKIKYGLVYLNDYKRVKETIAITPKLVDDNISALKAKDTTYYRFKLITPKKIENPGYFKISIAENGLHYGLNGNNVELE